MKAHVKARAIAIAVAVVLIAALFWFSLPALNLRSPEFWMFVIEALIVVLVCLTVAGFDREAAPAKSKPRIVQMNGGQITLPTLPSFPKSKVRRALLFAILGIIALMVVASVIGSTFFNAGRYKQILVKQEGNFTEDIAELSMSQIPVVDRDTAILLGRRKLGDMGATSDLVSQFEISDDYYTQINYQNRPVRVTPLQYGDIIKWFNNQSKGVPAYLRVDMVTQDTEMVRLEQGIKYAPCEYLMRDLKRYLRFAYPTKIFDESYSFEIDEDGVPYWVASTVQYRVGLWSAPDVEGAVLVNAVTGEHRYYAVQDIPTWVDRVYHADLIMQQLDWNGQFQKGFWNAHFGQSGVLSTTDGYNYIAHSDDVYLYTGMTSVASDQSNVGFVLVNMRTKETKFYSVSGATENSARDSAKGQVQDLGYDATFPLLLNVAERPTYFMALKDGAGMIKMYAFVDVNRYNLVGTGASVSEARSNYVKVLGTEEGPTVGGKPVTGAIAAMQTVVRDGNTVYYFLLEGADTVYAAPLTLSERLPFYKVGDRVTITFTGDKGAREVLTIETAQAAAAPTPTTPAA